ncbi:hypothetical protein D5I55_12200 [Chakrabartia godavariana]|nr:hypothetical protein D5I55_12200 [Chakrabartia godavariana]
MQPMPLTWRCGGFRRGLVSKRRQPIGVPREETLADFDKKSRPLTELPSHECGGIIWGILNPKADADFSLLSDQVNEDLEHLGLTTWFKYGYRRFELDANWKLVMEPFLEGYHVQRLHVNSIGPQGLDFFDDVVPKGERFGPHIRQISGRGKYTPEVLDRTDINIRSHVTIVYNLFPNTVVITSPYYISVMIMMPTASGRTNVDYYMLTETAPDNPKAEETPHEGGVSRNSCGGSFRDFPNSKSTSAQSTGTAASQYRETFSRPHRPPLGCLWAESRHMG